MVAPSIRVDGIKELNRELRRVRDKELDNELKAIHKGIAEDVLRGALPHVPVDTGALRRSVRAAGTKAAAVGRAGKKSVPYAPVVHWGGRGHRARPFLQDAARRVEHDIVARYDAAVAGMLNRVIKGN